MKRLSPGILILGFFAILFGLLAAYGAKHYLTQPVAQAAEAPKVETVMVPLAVTDLPAGRTIVVSDVLSLPMTHADAVKAKLPAMFMTTVSQIVGRTLKQAVPRGQAFEPTVFYPAGLGSDLTESLKPGERVVTISFKKDSPDLAFITPGSIVDVLFRVTPDAKAQITDATVTLLSRVRVLAIGQNTLPGLSSKEKDGSAQTVSLAVNQTQSRALKVVEGRGSLTLTLRNSKDDAVADKGGPTNLQNLMGIKNPPHPYYSEIYRRGRRTEMQFQDGLLQKIKLDPPFGLPVQGRGKDDGDDLELWPNGWGWGYGPTARPNGGNYGGNYRGGY